MPFIEMLPGVLVAISFYSFYRNLFPESPGYRIVSIAFFFSISAVGFAIIFEKVLRVFVVFESYPIQAFVLSSFPEELAKFLFLFIYFRLAKIEHSLSEGIFYGILFGLFFGLVENAFYSLDLGIWPMLVRSTTALPLHMLTSGILGGFILIYQNSNTRNSPFIELIYGFIICFTLHGLYNLAVFSSGQDLYWLPILLFSGFGILEYEIMKAQNTLPREVMQLIGIKWDDYEIVRKFKQHLDWMDVDQEKFHKREISIIRIPKIRIIIFSVFLLLVGICFWCYLYLSPELIAKTFQGIQFPEYVSIFVFYPMFTGFVLSFSGSLNPEYFRFMILRIPVLVSVQIRSGKFEETTVVFFLSRKGFYVPLLDPAAIQDKIEMEFWIAGRTIGGIEGVVFWKDIADKDREGGALIHFSKIPWRLIFWWKFVLFRQRIKNLLPIFQ